MKQFWITCNNLYICSVRLTPNVRNVDSVGELYGVRFSSKRGIHQFGSLTNLSTQESPPCLAEDAGSIPVVATKICLTAKRPM